MGLLRESSQLVWKESFNMKEVLKKILHVLSSLLKSVSNNIIPLLCILLMLVCIPCLWPFPIFGYLGIQFLRNESFSLTARIIGCVVFCLPMVCFILGALSTFEKNSNCHNESEPDDGPREFINVKGRW